ANGRLVTTDLAAALFFMCSLTTIWWLLHHVRPLSVLASAASLAALFLAKLSAVLIIPVGLVLLVVRLIRGGPLPVSWGRRRREFRSRFGQLGCFAGVLVLWVVSVYVCIWGAYGFRYAAMAKDSSPDAHLFTNSPVPPGRTLWEHVLRGNDISDGFRDTIGWLRDHHVFPEAYIYSAAYARQTARGRNSYLDGELAKLGFRSFFPKAFLYKTPLPLFALIVAALAALFARRKDAEANPPSAAPAATWTWSRNERESQSLRRVAYWSAPLWVFFIIYWYSSVSATLNIGLRHILPTYPVLFIFCGAAALLSGAHNRVVRYIPVALVALFAAASISIYPNYLTYFNLVAGGPSNGYRHLVDSSLDWGQDLPGLSAYLRERRTSGDEQPVFLSYFGSAGRPGIKHYGIEATLVPPSWPRDAVGDLRYRPGVYAISATDLQNVYSGVYESGERVLLNPWTPQLETIYRRLLPAYAACMAAENTAGARAAWTTSAVQRDMREFLTLQFARLCAYLRTQTPDHVVNHTIMIYVLDQGDLDAALNGPIAPAS
ncbi:MAG TPA: hypothetical protein P5572_15635, partial [Phycisphaerae bacterium]|nr:hypothetical protein [Phycisphaerae bacterium]